MADGLEITSPRRVRRVPFGAVALIAEPMAFIAAEAVLGDELTDQTATITFNTGHEARLFTWPCTCAGAGCGPDEMFVATGTRVLVAPAGTMLDELTPIDMP